RVHYGTDFEALTETAETADDSTTIKISNLENDTQYFFAVSAVDSKNEEGVKSITIAVTPVADEEVTEEGEGEISEDDLNPSAPETETPALNLPPASLYNNPLGGSASSNTVTLTWQAFPGINAAYYKVYFGLRSGQYDDYVLTPDNRTNFAVQDLINNLPYYFAVAALDFSGNEISPLSAEFVITPRGAGFQSLPADQVIPGQPVYRSPLENFKLAKVPGQEATGAEALWIALASVFFAAMFYFYKRRLIRR
ncbi:MAG: fibronectin type III domain-containing protein, partial [Candidatus Peregrinibacteria bacterium]|nr:fibronectin type III domain-containing protein [Candidatus Peregrinibacteria bacterium]